MAVKAALIGLLLVAVLRPDLPQFEGKAMTGRAVTYPLAAIVVPVAWWLWLRKRGWSYPYGLDICLVLPFLIDVVGKALDLYDTIDWWDDLNHFVNWGILTTAFGLLLLRFPLGRLNTAALMVGFGAVTAVLWEFAEYFTFIRGGSEEKTAYTDTLGDLALGLTGSTLAAVATVVLLWRPPQHLSMPTSRATEQLDGNQSESDFERPPEPGFARREAINGEEDA